MQEQILDEDRIRWIPPPDHNYLYKPWNTDTIVVYLMVGARSVGKTTFAAKLKSLFERNFKIDVYIFHDIPLEVIFYHLKNLLICLRKSMGYVSTTFIIIDKNMYDYSARLQISTLCHIFMVHVVQLFLLSNVSEIFDRNSLAIQSGRLTSNLIIQDIIKSTLPNVQLEHETRLVIPSNYRLGEYNTYLSVIEVTKNLVEKPLFASFSEDFIKTILHSGQSDQNSYFNLLFFPYNHPERNLNSRRLEHKLLFDYTNLTKSAITNVFKIVCQRHLLSFTDKHLSVTLTFPTYEDVESDYDQFVKDINELQRKSTSRALVPWVPLVNQPYHEGFEPHPEPMEQKNCYSPFHDKSFNLLKQYTTKKQEATYEWPQVQSVLPPEKKTATPQPRPAWSPWDSPIVLETNAADEDVEIHTTNKECREEVNEEDDSSTSKENPADESHLENNN